MLAAVHRSPTKREIDERRGKSRWKDAKRIGIELGEAKRRKKEEKGSKKTQDPPSSSQGWLFFLTVCSAFFFF
jgi:hypothetical protein